MTDDDYDEEHDPLLVRPYLRDDAGADTGDPSTQTWPSATTREVRSQRALEGADDPTVMLFLPDLPRRRFRHHRALILITACALVVLGATAAAVAALRTGSHPSAPNALPEAPIPALTGLVPSVKPSSSAAASSPAPRRSAHRSATAAATGRTATAKPSVTTTTGDGGLAMAPDDEATPAVPTENRTGTIRGQTGLCLDLNGGVAVELNHVQVFTCNDTDAQRWTLATDGTLRVQGLCALIVGDNTVHVINCDTRATAQWRISGQQLINAANNKCLTDPSAGATSGTGVTVTTCNDTAGERWSLP